MDKRLQRNKQILRSWLRTQYSDAKLVELLGHAQSGLLAYHSCCCFIGIVTANHPLRGHMTLYQMDMGLHYRAAQRLPGALEAEDAYYELAAPFESGREGIRQRRIIPIVKAEIRRRISQRAEENKENDGVLHSGVALSGAVCK